VGQIKVPVLSASSMQSAVSQLEDIQDAAAEVDMDQVGTAMVAAMPMAATGGLAFITGWLVSSPDSGVSFMFCAFTVMFQSLSVNGDATLH
jgi:hypothetical protein